MELQVDMRRLWTRSVDGARLVRMSVVPGSTKMRDAWGTPLSFTASLKFSDKPLFFWQTRAPHRLHPRMPLC